MHPTNVRLNEASEKYSSEIKQSIKFVDKSWKVLVSKAELSGVLTSPKCPYAHAYTYHVSNNEKNGVESI